MSEGVSAIVFTFNEEANIAACIESFAGVDEVIIADDGSTDRTRQIAKSLGAMSCFSGVSSSS
jgi:glycosyltransferase involved in cell wall biosynthesis